MFAIAFDLDIRRTKTQHSRGVQQAYADIRPTLKRFGFEWKQGSVYTCDNEDLGNLFAAIYALKSLAWFPPSVRDLRAFRVEQWSDFMAIMKA